MGCTQWDTFMFMSIYESQCAEQKRTTGKLLIDFQRAKKVIVDKVYKHMKFSENNDNHIKIVQNWNEMTIKHPVPTGLGQKSYDMYLNACNNQKRVIPKEDAEPALRKMLFEESKKHDHV